MSHSYRNIVFFNHYIVVINIGHKIFKYSYLSAFMSCQDIVKIENPDFYLDVAFKQANKRLGLFREKRISNRFLKSKTLEIERVKTISRSLGKQLRRIIDSFPSLDQMPDFYSELMIT